MQKGVRFTIFKTKWGYFGLAFAGKRLLRTVLPATEREAVGSQLLKNLPFAKYDKNLLKAVQALIIAYFEGQCVDFRDIPVELDGFSSFSKRVLTACQDIGFGRTVTYGRLAELAGKHGAGRAVGGVLAKNPLPLIIPCHRVVCANGSLGGFSAAGGIGLKKRMLELEAGALKG
ncbi:MAG: methylated-DNA--[protein]-cysteine S-methyltransferase [Sedimentisphaerales bacterium]|nr:methylated-DNA--[protein]-cysteine S-methyltransferase [Sedimentisphaerales bacterium]